MLVQVMVKPFWPGLWVPLNGELEVMGEGRELPDKEVETLQNRNK
jgi:hypothetical protein